MFINATVILFLSSMNVVCEPSDARSFGSRLNQVVKICMVAERGC